MFVCCVLQTRLLTRAPARAAAPRHRAGVRALLRGESRVPGAQGQLPEGGGRVRRGPASVRELWTKPAATGTLTTLPLGLCAGHRRAEPLPRLQAKFASFKARMVRRFG